MSAAGLPACRGVPITDEKSSSIKLDRTVRTHIEDCARRPQAIGGRDYDGPLKKVAEMVPDVADLLLAFLSGDVISRPDLSLRKLQISTVAVLLAHRSAQAQLRFHVRGVLNVGVSIDDLVGLLVIASGLLKLSTASAVVQDPPEHCPLRRVPGCSTGHRRGAHGDALG